MILYDAQGKHIRLGESIGRGGEAVVYRVHHQAGWLAKIYERAPRPNYPDKLSWMVSHPPENPTRSIAHPSIAWPSGLLYDAKHKLAGYLMPHIHSAVPILEVFNPRRRLATLPRFDRRYLHRTARNLAATLTALHTSGYVAGDLNESNVLVTPSALISLIDADSFQVQEVRGNQIVNHPCPVGKLEYTAPELQNLAIGSLMRQPEQDAFALAVLIFQLLMDGNHPFRAQWLGGGDPPPIETRIAQGYFPYTTMRGSLVRPPKSAPDLNRLHPVLAELILRCFTDGHNHPQQRPGPEQWERALHRAENALVECQNHHLYSNHLSGCPDCGAAASRAEQSTPKVSGHRSTAAYQRSTTARRAVSHPPPGRPARAQRVQPPPAFHRSYRAPSFPAFNWKAFIASRMNIPRPAPAYPSGTPSPPGPGTPSPSRPNQNAQNRNRPAGFQGNPLDWIGPRLSKSLVTGGGLGALAGTLASILVGMASTALDEMVAWTILWALGGAAAGLIRGWTPGYKMSLWVNRRIGWHRVIPALGLLAGAVGGMLVGICIGWWAILPVFFGLFSGARLGKLAGRVINDLGARLGWERIWAGLSAGAAALAGWQAAVWVGGGPVGDLVAQGAASLSGSTPGLLAAAGLCGALGGAVSGVLIDLAARFTGLVD